jgi:hypothetical protein
MRFPGGWNIDYNELQWHLERRLEIGYYVPRFSIFHLLHNVVFLDGVPSTGDRKNRTHSAIVISERSKISNFKLEANHGWQGNFPHQ